MKTNFYYLLPAALLALAACSSETDFTQEDVQQAQARQDVPVAFSTYLGTAGGTRASNPSDNGTDISTDAKLQSSGFGVFAYLTGASYAGNTAPNFMYNQQVTYSTDHWTYTPVKYWPNGIDAANAANSPSNTATQDNTNPKLLSFFAYAPYVSANASSGDDGIITLPTNSDATRPVITYKLPSTPTASNSVDLLWGIRGQLTYNEADGGNNTVAALSNETYNENLTKQTTTERVKFLFKHALAKIGAIKVVADIDGNSSLPTTSGFGSLDGTTLVTLEEINIKDADGTVVTQNKFDISTGQWSTTSGDITKASSGATVAADIKAKSSRTTGITTSLWELESGNPTYSSGWTSPGAGVPTNTPADIYSSDYSPIMFIPGSGQKLAITVKYVVRTYDSALDATTASGEGQWTKVTQTITNNVTLPNMQPNTSYTLVMHLGLTSVKFSAEVSNWDGGSAEVVWLPSNVVGTTAATIPAGNSTTTVNTASTTTSYEVTLTGLTPSATYTLAIGSGSTSGITFTPAAGSVTAGADGMLKVTVGGFSANTSTSSTNTVTAKIELTKDGSTTTNTVEIVQDKKAE